MHRGEQVLARQVQGTLPQNDLNDPKKGEEMNKKKRGRPRKGNMEGMPGRPRGPKSKEDDKDMYDFEEDDSKAMQPGVART